MRPTEDSYRHKGLRRKLVDEVRSKGIQDEKVLEAIGRVPRHFFLDSAFGEQAYEDKAFPIEVEQTISQPYTVAFQTELLDLKPFCKVLEIGTGSAYQAVILAELNVQVFSIERQRKLFDINKQFTLLKKYPTLKCFYGDGFEGLPTYAPFDRVLITAAVEQLPSKLIQQLKTGGKLVVPLGDPEKTQTMKRYTRMADGSLQEESFSDFSFVPMLPDKSG